MDKTKQELREQYEDALFALMMEEYAQDEGKQLLERERQLKDDSDFQVPEDFEAKGLQIIRRACRKKHQSINSGRQEKLWRGWRCWYWCWILRLAFPLSQ